MLNILTVYILSFLVMQDIKRGYAFVFLRDPKTIEEKNRIETYVGDINGMYVSSSSTFSLSSSMSTIICST